jgi:transposase-like protein
MFSDPESAQSYLESRLWPDGPRCPACGTGDRITVRKGGFYRCNACKIDFTIRTGTIFHRSHIPLHKWINGIESWRRGISSAQLARDLDITQKTAWWMLWRLNELTDAERRTLRRIIEPDR